MREALEWIGTLFLVITLSLALTGIIFTGLCRDDDYDDDENGGVK